MTTIVTLKLDESSQRFFEAQRRKYFPPERNQIGAHLTLFHTLPDTPEISDALAGAAGARTVFGIDVTGLRSLGKGVAYTMRSTEAAALHSELATAFQDHLTPQDRQRFSPHVVVQNKTTPEKARALLTQLQAGFEPFTVTATGLELWRYLGGPWEPAAEFAFAGSTA